VILSNQNSSQLPTVVSYDVYDRLLGLDQIDWTKRLKTRERGGRGGRAGTEEAKRKGYTAQVQGTHPSHQLSDYAGDFESPAYGIASVSFQNGALQFSFHGEGGLLNHYHYDVFEVAEQDLGHFSREKVTFHTDLWGDIDSLSVPFEATVKEIVFSRVPDRSMQETTFLRPLTGAYQRGAGTVTVAMKGDHAITLALAGQPAADLEPVRGTRFRIKGQNGSSVEFKGEDLVFYQANSVSVATRKK